MIAERRDEPCHAAGGDERRLFAELLLHSVNDTVDGGSIPVHDAVSHTFDGVLSDDAFGDIQVDPGKLRCVAYQGV